jgi:N utilization substance protein A
VLVLKVERGPRGPKILLSRSHPLMVQRLFEQEVPEVYEKMVEVMDVVREPGFRSKVAVRSNNPKIDPVGACVGVKGSRVRPIIDELRGERIDLIFHSPDAAKYIANSLSPVKKEKIVLVNIISEAEKKAEIVVADDELSLAIGKSGQNARLAARLTGWHIDIKSETQRREALQERAAASAEALSHLEGVSAKTIEILIKGGWGNLEKISHAKPDDLTVLRSVGEKTAVKIIESAKAVLLAKEQSAAAAAQVKQEAPVPAEPAESAESPAVAPASEENA